MDREERVGCPDAARLTWRRRALRAAVFGGLAGIALVTMSAASALAADDDEEDELSFEQKIIRNLMHGIGAVDGTEKGITYQERSPLVVPPKLNLPTPQVGQSSLPSNWPKDPDVQERKKMRQLAKKQSKIPQEASWAPLTPEQLNPKGTEAFARSKTSQRPGDNGGVDMGRPLTPTELGVKNLNPFAMFGKNKIESEPFTGEPPREGLTQPPVGYQTPSPNYAYGTGEQDAKPRNPDEEYSVYPKQPGKF